jgi:hypothetical protein
VAGESVRRPEVVAKATTTAAHRSAADAKANELAGLHVGDCVLRRGELHTVVAIDRSLSPIAYTVQNHTTGAVVETELSFLSLPKRAPTAQPQPRCASSPCAANKLDTAAAFGTCRCGHKKAAHSYGARPRLLVCRAATSSNVPTLGCYLGECRLL